MRARTVLALLLIALIVIFVILNWVPITTPMTLSLGYTQIEAPLGLVMLGLLGALALIFAAYMAFWQGSVLVETRRHTKEMQAQRTLADQAEASRFTELRAAMQTEFATLADRLDKAQTALRTELRESTNSLAATIGEIEDRLTRQRGGGDASN